MAAALAEFVSNQLISLASHQASLLWGLETEIPKLANTVSSIQAVLRDAEEQSGKNHQAKLWLQRLEDVLYEAEDLLDDFSTEVLRREKMDGNRVVNEVCLFFSESNQVVYRLKIANQIKALRSKLEEIDRNKNQFNFQTCPVEPNKEWRQTHSSVPDVVIGREGDKQIIIDILLSSSYEEKVVVVPIVGIGGLGKTALAQLVYNDHKIKSHFDSTYWVCVSETFEPKVLVKNILESITKQNVEDLVLETLKDRLHQQIKNKRLLLVLDDVWNEDPEKWASFMNIFSSGATKGSRIVVTTRLRMVAEMTASEKIVPHELQGLSEHDSWSLFEKMAFKGGVASSPRYVKIGKEVLRKCCGVPLAIRIMGGLLFYKDTVSEWERIADKQLLNLDLGGQESEILERTLKLSYDNLPSNLKRCFAYCSLFPKDHKINVKMLVQLWMAQGYIIKSSQSSELADIGIGYFKNLLWRSFFQEAEKDRWGNIRFCKMHDLVHDLAVVVAGDETVCLKASNLSDSFFKINLERIRHLSIDFEERSEHKVCQLPDRLTKATKLRTFLIVNVHDKGVKLQGRCEKIFPNMTRLRVLGLPYVNIEMVSSIIHVLKHLRYLDLSYNKEMKILSNNMTRLINLQVLNLCGCINLRLLSADIGKLSNLAYLVLNSSLTCIPVGIGNLSFLRELSHFIVVEAAATADCSSQSAGLLGELKSLNNLSGELSIRGLERVTDKSEAEAANLKEKSQLQFLELCWSNGNFMTRRIFDADPDHERSVLEALQPHPNLKEIWLHNYGGASIPTTTRSCCWFSSLRNLVRMGFYGCRKLRSLPSLDPLVSLEELKLWELESLEYVQSLETSSSSSNNDFQSLPSLVSLDIICCRNLIGWSPTSVQDSPLLPGVSRLTIWNCPKMVSVPRFRVNFEGVQLTGVSNEVLSVFAASLISPPTHPRFHSLSLWRVKDLPQELMPHLTSLESLFFQFCNMTTLSPSILRHLPSLQELHILNCPVLELEDYDDYGDGDDDDDENNNTLSVLPSLRSLYFYSVPKLVALPKWLQHSSTLRLLVIEKCKNLKCLPSWLTKLTALEYLRVQYCDILSGRCRSNTAEDWPNISHIPTITIDYIDVQKDGCYLGIEEEEEESEEEEEEEEEASSHSQISRLLEIYFARITCNLFQRCFLP